MRDDVDYYGGGGFGDVGDRDYYEDYDFEGVETVGLDVANMSVGDLYSQCLGPNVSDAFDSLGWLLMSCLLLRVLNHLLNFGGFVDHMVSTGLGLVALFSIAGKDAVFTIIPAVLGYLVILRCARGQNNPEGRPGRGVANSQIATIFLVCYLVVREYTDFVPESWVRVRGIQMIMVMKILSICFDMGEGGRLGRAPPFHQYLGYVFCPVNLIFGPWIPFDTYVRLFIVGPRPADPNENVGIWWILPALGAGGCAVLTLGVSSCLLDWLFVGTESRWVQAFRDAMEVRFSHYFISFLSELCCLLGGYVDEGVITVSEPWRIEIPRSLVDVVVCWNKPMHRWLRVYIFRPCLAWGAFKAVLVTFAISSMLHGLNFGLTSVLLSLGAYTYVEHRLREKLAGIYDACIRSRSCPDKCSHKYKSDNCAVIGVNFAFGILACFNLAYLGVMISKGKMDVDVDAGMESEPGFGHASIFDDIKKWSDLGFLSHLVMILLYLATLVI